MPLAQIAPVINEALSAASQVEKLSVLGVIALWAMLASWSAWKLNRKLIVIYRQRDRARDYALLYRTVLDSHNIKVDTAHIDHQYQQDVADEAAA